MFYLVISRHTKMCDFTILNLTCVEALPIQLVLSEPHLITTRNLAKVNKEYNFKASLHSQEIIANYQIKIVCAFLFDFGIVRGLLV